MKLEGDSVGWENKIRMTRQRRGGKKKLYFGIAKSRVGLTVVNCSIGWPNRKKKKIAAADKVKRQRASQSLF